jgi:hypothetical protein
VVTIDAVNGAVKLAEDEAATVAEAVVAERAQNPRG